MPIFGCVKINVLSINILVRALDYLGSLTSHVIGNVCYCTLVGMQIDPRFF